MANVLVRSTDDLTITGLVDVEWVYAGPAQFLGSAPWWLLLDGPVNEEWDFEDGKAPKDTARYFPCLDIFMRVLGEEERTANGHELTDLVKWSRDTGAMWLHMLLSSGFFDNLTFPCMQLREHKGTQSWDQCMETGEVEDFIARKLKDLDAYDEIKDKVEHHKVLLDNKEMSAEEFISRVSSILGSDSSAQE